MVEYIESSLDQAAGNINLGGSLEKKEGLYDPKIRATSDEQQETPPLVSSKDSGLGHYAHSQRTLSTGERSTRTFDPKRISNNDRRIPRKAQSGKLGNGVVTSLGGGIIP